MLHSCRRVLASTIFVIALLGAGTGARCALAATTPEQDFAARCGAAGVLVCQGFDSANTFVYSSTQSDGVYPIYGTNTIRIYQDTSVKVSGTSSARFDIPAYTSADATGNFQAAFHQNFGANSTFYVQYQARFDTNFATIDWDALAHTSPKLSVLYDGNGIPCANIELTTVEYYGTGYPSMYSQCGSRSVFGSTTNLGSWNTSVPFLIQQGSSATSGYNCQYGQLTVGSGNGPGCYKYPANTWITFYYKVHIGDWGQPNSSIQAFVSVNGGPYRQWININNYTLLQDGSTSGAFNRIMLTPYMTGMSNTVNHPLCSVWYDELIVSTQPIAAPGTVVVRPNPPTNLKAN
jgi:hypothetical protein